MLSKEMSFKVKDELRDKAPPAARREKHEYTMRYSRGYRI